MKKSRKGVSEIVATVLMILIVTTIGFGVVSLSMNYFSGVSSARDVANKINIDAIRENFIIVNTLIDTASSNVSVWVYNYGETNLRMTAMYLNGTQLANFEAPAYIVPASMGIINGTYPGAIGNAPQLIRAVSTLGNYYENYYMP